MLDTWDIGVSNFDTVAEMTSKDPVDTFEVKYLRQYINGVLVHESGITITEFD